MICREDKEVVGQSEALEVHQMISREAYFLNLINSNDKRVGHVTLSVCLKVAGQKLMPEDNELVIEDNAEDDLV